jgi:hypothetical protein
MLNRFKVGVPIAAGLATGGYALSQGEDPGTAALAAGAGALGGAAGLLGARQLAGKYADVVPSLLNKGIDKGLGKSGRSIRQRVEQQIVNSPEYLSRGQAATLYSPETVGNVVRTGLLNLPASLQAASKPVFGALAAPAAAGVAGLGGVALGAIPASMGVPGFQQGGPVDPESYGSSNSAGARYKTPTMQYM